MGLGWVYDWYSMGYRINRLTRSLERRKGANRRFYMEAAGSTNGTRFSQAPNCGSCLRIY